MRAGSGRSVDVKTVQREKLKKIDYEVSDKRRCRMLFIVLEVELTSF